MLQHPEFLKVLVLAPKVFGKFCDKSIIFHEKDVQTISNIVIPLQNLKSSSYSLKFLTKTLNSTVKGPR